jgi:hypothetical protein
MEPESAQRRIRSYVDQVAGTQPHNTVLMVHCDASIRVMAPAIRTILNIAITTRSFVIMVNRFVM